MKVETFAKGLPSLLADAKKLWGEHSSAEMLDHDFPAKRKGFRPDNNEFGVFADYSHVPDELYLCVNCGVDWGLSIRNSKGCQIVGTFNMGHIAHLRSMIASGDPKQYLKENS